MAKPDKQWAQFQPTEVELKNFQAINDVKYT